jgi:hypothetical protein
MRDNRNISRISRYNVPERSKSLVAIGVKSKMPLSIEYVLADELQWGVFVFSFKLIFLDV